MLDKQLFDRDPRDFALEMVADGNGWSVNFRRGDERQTVVLTDYPAKRYYSDEELAQFANKGWESVEA